MKPRKGLVPMAVERRTATKRKGERGGGLRLPSIYKMGEYFHIANLDKKEYLYDHKFHDFGYVGGHGVKWGEITFGKFTTLQLLSILVTSYVPSYGGRESNVSFVGRWYGDRIIFPGDYSAARDYEMVCETFKDITPDLIKELLELPWWKEEIEKTEWKNRERCKTCEGSGYIKK